MLSIELLVTTAEGVDGDEVIVCVGASAYPAPLKAAEVARHVVAPLHLLHSCLAFGAVGDVDVAFGPVFELLLHLRVARGAITMPLVSALEAESLGACVASDLLGIKAFSPYIALAPSFSAPSDQWITLHRHLFPESF